MLAVRPMTGGDLPAVESWLSLPHVARWWAPQTTPAEEIAEYRHRISEPAHATIMLVVTLGGKPVGWGQWYRWADYPADAAAIGARGGEAGIDYAIGEPAQTGRGADTVMIGVLVAEVRRHLPGAGLLAAPEAANAASRRVLEKNGFRLVAVRPISTEPHDRPMAIYRLPPATRARYRHPPGEPPRSRPAPARVRWRVGYRTDHAWATRR